MYLLKLKKTNDFKLLFDWCLTIYDYLESLNSDFSFETGWYRSVIVKATRNKDLGLLKGVYKETNLMVRETLEAVMITALNEILKEKFGCDLADEHDKERLRILKIIKHGKIRNNREFELIKQREEEIWQDNSQADYAETLRQLMSEYEGGTK